MRDAAAWVIVSSHLWVPLICTITPVQGSSIYMYSEFLYGPDSSGNSSSVWKPLIVFSKTHTPPSPQLPCQTEGPPSAPPIPSSLLEYRSVSRTHLGISLPGLGFQSTSPPPRHQSGYLPLAAWVLPIWDSPKCCQLNTSSPDLLGSSLSRIWEILSEGEMAHLQGHPCHCHHPHSPQLEKNLSSERGI